MFLSSPEQSCVTWVKDQHWIPFKVSKIQPLRNSHFFIILNLPFKTGRSVPYRNRFCSVMVTGAPVSVMMSGCTRVGSVMHFGWMWWRYLSLTPASTCALDYDISNFACIWIGFHLSYVKFTLLFFFFGLKLLLSIIHSYQYYQILLNEIQLKFTK